MDSFDIDYQRAVLLSLLVVLNLALLGAVVTSSAPYGPYNGAWDGGSTLRTTAGEAESLSIAHSTGAYTEGQPSDSVAFVVAPQRQYGATDRARVRQFVQQGGTLVVAADDNRTNQFLSALGVEIRIDGRLVRDEQENYRGPSLPVATNVADSNLTDGVDGLTLNYGSVIDLPRNGTGAVSGVRGWQGRILTNTSGFAYIDENRNETLDDDETLRERPVVATEPLGNGRVVVVSDGSVFTNAMLERSGNRQFLRNLVGASQRAVVDYSHGHQLPPLLFALLVVRDLPLFQFGLAVAALAAVALWTRGGDLSGLVGGADSDDSTAETARLDADELAAFLADRHPEWDGDRVQHVTKAIIRSRRQPETDD